MPSAPLILRTVLADEEASAALLEFARQEFSDENLLFYRAVQKFKSEYASADPAVSPPAILSAMVDNAMSIICDYCATDADMAVSLPASNPFKARPTREELEPSVGMFDALAAVAFKALEHDVFVRFCQTDRAAALLQSNGDLALLPGASARRAAATPPKPPSDVQKEGDRTAGYMAAAVGVGVVILLISIGIAKAIGARYLQSGPALPGGDSAGGGEEWVRVTRRGS